MKFWEDEGAKTVEEWCAYCDYCFAIEAENYGGCLEKYPDMDPEDFPLEEAYAGVPTFAEWKAAQA